MNDGKQAAEAKSAETAATATATAAGSAATAAEPAEITKTELKNSCRISSAGVFGYIEFVVHADFLRGHGLTDRKNSPTYPTATPRRAEIRIIKIG